MTTLGPKQFYLPPAQILAVVYLADIYGDPFCSGTLIADRLIATARHCVPDAKARRRLGGLWSESES